MSQKQKAERARKAQTQERNRNLLRAGGAALALTMVAIGGKAFVSGESAPSNEVHASAAAPESDQKIPAALKTYLERESKTHPTADYEKFAADYHPIEQRQIGPSKVHYARVGDAEARPREIELHAESYQRFLSAADKQLKFLVNAYPSEQVERADLAITPAQAEIIATPDAEKDLYVLFVDEKSSLGKVHNTESSASALTIDFDDSSEAAVTFIRNDHRPTENAYMALATEACQAAISFEITNSADFNIGAEKGAGNMADEPGCNLFGPLVAAKALGQSYATYESRRKEALSGKLFFATDTSTHAIEIPVAQRQYYESFPLSGDIPAPGPEDLKYPLMDPFLSQ